MKIICDCNSDNVSIMAVQEKDIKVKDINTKIAKITYICNDCGKTEVRTEYLYK
ncbi:MAG: hypothetical protein K0R54_733 [Clostridiaceae bacterium]|jgi:hypothetical protein|nr:hypothetical protein [Clostridiaceae bacterium]